jgi:large subunit ribosomal protein L30
MADKSKVKITLVKSTNGRIESHKATVRGLGLKKIRQTSILEDTPCIRGMINKVSYLVKTENI